MEEVMNEDKVREAIALGHSINSDSESTVRNKMLALLAEAITPEQPEIPKGCPVLVWNYRKYIDCTETFYTEGMEDNYKHVEIDYQRKGHVIPWHGGECPVDDKEAMITIYDRMGNIVNGASYSFDFEHDGNNVQKHHEIIAYVIWPEWVNS